jgi:hypothetical protein
MLFKPYDPPELTWVTGAMQPARPGACAVEKLDSWLLSLTITKFDAAKQHAETRKTGIISLRGKRGKDDHEDFTWSGGTADQ